MTLYAGEIVQIRQHAADYNEETLTNAQVTATVTVWDLDGTTQLVDDEPMIYSAGLVFEDGTIGGWYYQWATPPVFGSYVARCKITGVDILAWEFKTIRLRQNKAA